MSGKPDNLPDGDLTRALDEKVKARAVEKGRPRTLADIEAEDREQDGEFIGGIWVRRKRLLGYDPG